MGTIIGDKLQEEVLDYLGSAAAHGLADAPVRIDTHCSVVFLAGENVYKVKRSIKLPFLDYSTLERRKHFCEREFAINHKLAPQLYRGVIAIRRGPEGLHLGRSGEVVEWAVHLQRFDERRTLDRLADAGKLDPQIIRDLAAAVSAAHSAAKVVRNGHATEALEVVIQETLNELRQAADIFPRATSEEVSRAMRASFCEVRGLLAMREATGHVRSCHGDLHLRNIVLLKDKVTLFDAIEFDDKLATTDVLYDLAFLLMDLWHRNLKSEANTILNRYFWHAGDMIDELAGLSALPLFLGLRAAIRAKVAALNAARSVTSRHAAIDARLYFETAREFLQPHHPTLIAIGGRSGTGKSTLAACLAPLVGRPPGAIHLRSDIERKRQFGVAETFRLAPSAYDPQVSNRVYEALDRQAEAALRSGQSVIVDATFLSEFEANAVAEIAKRAKVNFRGIWLEAPTGLLMRRLFNRSNDASDATPKVLRRQPVAEAPAGWACLDASNTPAEIQYAATHCLGIKPFFADRLAG
ncbi:AAA family ATPase [Taklimakanibacter deserti]|uniref:bifunctional aminoglycoside phosphotransferase/ATP-binding protein n=1 Tax=Taklimakanibacter deserti TaxID=2267839 RepID=UPI000E658CCE